LFGNSRCPHLRFAYPLPSASLGEEGRFDAALSPFSLWEKVGMRVKNAALSALFRVFKQSLRAMKREIQRNRTKNSVA
jgi:hypothetical protein